MKEIIDFLCAESGSHDYTINRREAIELGLNVEKPSDSLYSLLRRLHLSYVDEFKLLDPYDPYSLLGANATVNYVLPRAAIESVRDGFPSVSVRRNFDQDDGAANRSSGPDFARFDQRQSAIRRLEKAVSYFRATTDASDVFRPSVGGAR